MATEYIYELLVRGTKDGLNGAHLIRGKEVTDEDGDTRQKIGKAEPLLLKDVAEVLGAETPKYIEQIQTLSSELDETTGKLHESLAEQQRLTAAIKASQHDLAVSQDNCAALTNQLKEAILELALIKSGATTQVDVGAG